MGEINFERGDRDGDEREWVCDSGADCHMTSDASLFSTLENVCCSTNVGQHRTRRWTHKIDEMRSTDRHLFRLIV